MNKHTPGPWKSCNPRFGNQFVRQDPKNWDGMGYQHICTLPSERKGTHYGEMFAANARLIAAAPELLEALQEIVNFWNDKVPTDLVNEMHKRGIAAIAKATGEKQ